MSPHRARILALFAVCLGYTALSALPVRAQELLAPRVTDRKFPQFNFCPFPLDLPFIADGPTATLRLSTTTVNYFNTSNSAAQWSHQSLDNLCVSPDDVYLANLGAPGVYSQDCYIGAPVAQRFYFQNAGALPLKELFSSDPALSGWDLAHGAYWNTSRSGPQDPGTETTFTPDGCLGLGEFDPDLALTDSAFTTVQVTSLTKGVTYHLTGWWAVEDMELNKVFLTVAVLSDAPTPIARRTWGVLKRRYE